MQCTPKATEFDEMTQNKGHNAVQAYSRSPILVPIESSYKLRPISEILTYLPPILHRFWDRAFDRSKITIFGYPSFVYFNSPNGGVP